MGPETSSERAWNPVTSPFVADRFAVTQSTQGPFAVFSRRERCVGP